MKLNALKSKTKGYIKSNKGDLNVDYDNNIKQQL